MKLKKFINSANGQICGGSEFGWSCYPDARYIDISDIDNREIGHCLASTKTQEVYEIELHVYEDNISYRWTHPNYINSRDQEALSRNIDPNIAYDDVNFTDITSEEEILKLVKNIVHKTYVHSHMPQEIISNNCVKNEDESTEPSMIQEYDVKITSVQCFSVYATTMEEAATKAKEFSSTMQPPEIYPNKLCWIDQYVSKEEVARKLMVEHTTE